MTERHKIIALQAALMAGDVLRKGFYSSVSISFQRKSDNSLVTDFDRRAEEVLIRAVREVFPDHHILAEESGGEIGDGYTWLFDPLDGTSNFVMKNPLFSVAITLLFERSPILCVVYCPVIQESYVGVRGEGVKCYGVNSARISTRKHLCDATISFTKGRGEEAFLRWHRAAGLLGGKARGIRVYGSSAYEICQVAMGRLDGVLNLGASPWDTIGPALIVQEAGGKATNLRGEAISLIDKDLLVTNGLIHDEALESLKNL